MSYHDGYDRPMLEGIAVVNPLAEQKKRLTRLEKFLQQMAAETDNAELRARIEKILDQ